MAATADRVLEVLELFKGGQTVWTVEDAAARIGLPASTVYRYFRSLSSAGLIYAYVAGRYSLGPAIVELDREIRLHDPLVTAARGEMAALATALGPDCVILLARLYNHGVMCVSQAFVERPNFAVSYERGRVMPIGRGAASKAILAHLPARQLRIAIGKDRSLTEQAMIALKADLRTIRDQGFSVTSGEIDEGLTGIAVPIFGQDQIVSGSLSAVLRDQDVGEVGERIDQLIGGQKRIEAEMTVSLRQLHSIDEP